MLDPRAKLAQSEDTTATLNRRATYTPTFFAAFSAFFFKRFATLAACALRNTSKDLRQFSGFTFARIAFMYADT